MTDHKQVRCPNCGAPLDVPVVIDSVVIGPAGQVGVSFQMSGVEHWCRRDQNVDAQDEVNVRGL